MVVITLTHTGKTKKTHVSPFEGKQPNVEYHSLEQYINIAKRCINKFCSRSLAFSMLRNEDAISFVVEELILGTAKFNGYGSLTGYLGLRAKWAIKRWVGLMKKQIKHDSLDYKRDEDRYDLHNYVIDHKAKDPTENTEQNYYDSVSIAMNLISDRQKECLSMYLLDGLRQTDIAKKLGISREAVRQHLNNGLNKIKKAEVQLVL